MWSSAGTQDQDDFLYTLFIQHRPVTACLILVSGGDILDNLGTMVDKILYFQPLRNMLVVFKQCALLFQLCQKLWILV